MARMPALRLAALCVLLAPVATALERPNVVLIVCDDLGAEMVGAYGGESFETPRIDELARTGLRFDSAYAQPRCVPSRRCLLTGRYAFRFSQDEEDAGWSAGQVTFANLARAAGYRTAIAGKWGLCPLAGIPDQAAASGFERHCLFAAGPADERERRRYWGPSVYRDGELEQDAEAVYGPDLFCQFLIDFMTERRDEPFLVYYPMVLVHAPWPRTPDTVGTEVEGWSAEDDLRTLEDPRYRRENLEAMVTYADRLVGRLVDALERLGLRERTLVLFTADNGGVTRLRSKVGPVTVAGGKGTVGEAGSRVPLVASWPGTIEPGGVDEGLVDLTDVLPTLAELCGASLPEDRTLDGTSFAGRLLGRPGPRREWVYVSYGGERWVRGERWSLLEDASGARSFFAIEHRYFPIRLRPARLDAEGVAAQAALGAVLDRLRAEERP